MVKKYPDLEKKKSAGGEITYIFETGSYRDFSFRTG